MGNETGTSRLEGAHLRFKIIQGLGGNSPGFGHLGGVPTRIDTTRDAALNNNIERWHKGMHTNDDGGKSIPKLPEAGQNLRESRSISVEARAHPV